ncbi:MAG: hypothetical protein HKN49_02180 [Gammaproteobacteria bacterium]|nr:hypothetical protein [Gammaproteobacteria bacterium]
MKNISLRLITLLLAALMIAASPVLLADDDDDDDDNEGRRLFDEETFGGNGRTCLTCHSEATGTISPQDVADRIHLGDPLFLHDGLDNGVDGTTRIEEHATIRVEIPLPPHITIKNSNATSVILNRGVPSTINTPALDPVLMYDGRDDTLQGQALGAIRGHAQSEAVSQAQLDLIAEFQQRDKRFFSSKALRKFAHTGKPPQLPDGTTAAEKRGRRMFDDVPFQSGSTDGICATCHSGPMLNRFNQHNPFGAPPGASFGSVLVSERNLAGNEEFTFIVQDPNYGPREITTPDPGVLLTDPQPPEFHVPPEFGGPLPLWFTANFFKVPQLWGVKDTAPYFHDNSAKTLEDVAEQYRFMFENSFDVNGNPLGIVLTEQDQADMVAFLKLLE